MADRDVTGERCGMVGLQICGKAETRGSSDRLEKGSEGDLKGIVEWNFVAICSD